MLTFFSAHCVGLPGGEQRQLNHEPNHNSRAIHRQRYG
jgi:hypothetical protein